MATQCEQFFWHFLKASSLYLKPNLLVLSKNIIFVKLFFFSIVSINDDGNE